MGRVKLWNELKDGKGDDVVLTIHLAESCIDLIVDFSCIISSCRRVILTFHKHVWTVYFGPEGHHVMYSAC